MPILALRRLLAAPGAGVAGQNEELPMSKCVALGLGGHLGLARAGVRVQRQDDDVFGRILGLAGANVVFEQAGLLAVWVGGPTFMVERTLHEREELVTVFACRQTFEALVVFAARDSVRWDDGFIRVVDGGPVGAETDAAVAVGDVCVWRHDRLLHFASGVELVYVRPVFIGDPEASLPVIDGSQNETFAINRNALTS